MLEKAKNRKIFYFFIIIILGFILFISVASADEFNIRAQKCLWMDVNGPSYIADLDKSSADGQVANTSMAVKLDCATTASKYKLQTRTSLMFDTSTLTGYLNEAYLRIYCQSTTDHGEGDMYIIAYTPDDSDDLVAGDFNNILAGTIVGSTTEADLTTNSWINITLDLSAINIEGYTHLALISEADYNNNPIWISGSLIIQHSFKGRADNTYYPRLQLITTDEPPYIANILSDKISGQTPLTVTFTDDSTGFPESSPYPIYEIEFGDGYSFTGERQYTGENWYHQYNVWFGNKTYQVNYTITYDGIEYIDSTNITVSFNENNYYVQVSGLNTAPISGANVTISYDGYEQDSEGTSEWGISYFDVPYNRLVTGTVIKPGYYNATFSKFVGTSDSWSNVVLYTLNETPADFSEYGNYILTFKNTDTGDYIEYSNIEVYSDSSYTTLFYDEYSNEYGVWSGLIPMNITYYYKYPETIGYYSQSWSYNLTSSPAYKTVNLVPKSSATSTPTPTPTSITTTITPIVTYTYNDSNLSTLNVKERFTNLLVLAGFQNAESADLIFAMIIVLGCTALIGWITLSGSGAGMGAIIGFVFALGLGLIPLWLLISAIFLGSLYVSLKLFGGTGE